MRQEEDEGLISYVLQGPSMKARHKTLVRFHTLFRRIPFASRLDLLFRALFRASRQDQQTAGHFVRDFRVRGAEVATSKRCSFQARGSWTCR